eukprot:Hpha_TRINITY_DN16118_c1_g14::TRINITY_DN16118_c1_g14_i5::g.8275::m.8275
MASDASSFHSRMSTPGSLSGSGWLKSPLEFCRCCRRFSCMLNGLMAAVLLLVAVETGALTAFMTTLEHEYKLTSSQVGTVVVAYDAAYVIGALPTGILCGKRIPFAIGGGLMLVAVATFGFGTSSSFGGFALCRLLLGVGALPLWTLGFVHVDNNVADKLRVPLYHARLLAIAPVGFVVGAALMAASFASAHPGACSADDDLVEECTQSHAAEKAATVTQTALAEYDPSCENWRVVYFGLALLVLPLGVWAMQSRVRYADKLSEQRAPPDFIESEPSPRRLQRRVRATSSREAVLLLLRNKRWRYAVLAAAATAFTSTAILSFIPRLLEQTYCLEKHAMALLMIALSPGPALGMHLGGWIPHKFNWGISKQVLQGLFSTAAVLLLSPIYFAPSVGILGALLLVTATLQTLSAAPYVNVVQRSVEPEHKPLAMSSAQVAVRLLGNLTGPVVMGGLIDAKLFSNAAWNYVLVSIAGYTVAACFWLALYRVHRRGVDEEWWLDFEEDLSAEELVAQRNKWTGKRIHPVSSPVAVPADPPDTTVWATRLTPIPTTLQPLPLSFPIISEGPPTEPDTA